MTGRRIYLMRHGDAVRGVPDEQRGLTPVGVRDVRAVSRCLAQLPIRCDRILSSPLRRARETAELVHEAFLTAKGRQHEVPYLKMSEEIVMADAFLPETRLASALDALDRPERSILVVTHLPLAEDLLGALVCREGSDIARIPPGAAMALRFAGAPRPGSGLLEWLLVPALVAPKEPPTGESGDFS